jgi:DNA-binding MarR family transcriptional regulator
MTEIEDRDHVDRFLEEHDLPGVDPEVEGIVDRINGLRRRFHAMADETLAELGLAEGAWKVLTTLRFAGPPYRRSVGKLAKRAELSSGAMTNRLDRLEEAGLVRRLPDPEDRRGVLVELTESGLDAYFAAVGVQAAKEASIAEPLTEREREQLNGLLRKVIVGFEQPGETTKDC